MEGPAQNDPSSASNPTETKEALPDFLQIFNERLQKIEPATGEDAKGMASWYKDPEILEIAKEAPVVFFDPNNLVFFAPPTDIWIENRENLDKSSHYMHDQVMDKLTRFLGTNKMPDLVGGYILEDSNGMRYIVLDQPRSRILRFRIESGTNNEERQDLAILDVLNKYKISKVIEKTSTTIRNEEGSRTTGSSQEVVGKSMLDKRREDIALINLARKHGMTNSQYLRLKILADTLFKAGKQVSLDEIAKSIVKDPDNEFISVKHLPLEEK